MQRELPPSPGQATESNKIPPPTASYTVPPPAGSRDLQRESPWIQCRRFWYD